MHIVSNLSGRIAPGFNGLDVLQAAFPAGTLTGAPKTAAMQLIDRLEPCRRGPYGGAVCYVSFNGNMDSCITIRTALVKDGYAHTQAGAGVVYDSDPEAEYEETRNKARSVLQAVAAASREEAVHVPHYR